MRKTNIIVAISALLWAGSSLAGSDEGGWPFWGGNTHNTRTAKEHELDPSNVGSLQVKWVFQTAGDVWTTAAVDEGHVYFPDAAGFIYSLDRETGSLSWSRPISDYTHRKNAFARATPAIAGDRLIFGDHGASATPEVGGAMVLAVDKHSGALLWSTKVDDHPLSWITASAVVAGDVAYVGVASADEVLPGCCSFRGNIVALDVRTGSILWKTYMVPPNGGPDGSFTGAVVWGSSPSVDLRRHRLYVATGNNYSVPNSVAKCVAAAAGQPDEAKVVHECMINAPGGRDNHFDSIVALDMDTGHIVWTRATVPFDAWLLGCLTGKPPLCPTPAGKDYDFGQAPALFTAEVDGRRRELVGAGQKSGKYWALDPDTGDVVWVTQVGPGGSLGGMMWGAAVGEGKVFAAIGNQEYTPFTFTTGLQQGRTVRGGFWAALDTGTGEPIWETAASNPPAVPAPSNPPDAIAVNTGPVTLANGVVYGGAIDAAGTMYAFDADTGAKLWSFESGGSVNAGAAIVDGTVYWGSGYQNIGIGTPNNKFYAFTTPRHGRH
jgi:polyvinyl alcohol dehydrogenase (cytochrome)